MEVLLSDYAKKLLLESGIDFASIPQNDMLAACGEYEGKISNENYNVVIRAINDIYDQKNANIKGT